MSAYLTGVDDMDRRGIQQALENGWSMEQVYRFCLVLDPERDSAPTHEEAGERVRLAPTLSGDVAGTPASGLPDGPAASGTAGAGNVWGRDPRSAMHHVASWLRLPFKKRLVRWGRGTAVRVGLFCLAHIPPSLLTTVQRARGVLPGRSRTTGGL